MTNMHAPCQPAMPLSVVLIWQTDFRDVSQPGPNSPATLSNPPSQSNSNSIPNNGGPDQRNSSKSRKSSSALERGARSEERGTRMHAYGTTLHKAARQGATLSAHDGDKLKIK
ncbi:hypothetical protein EYF80_001882 [Liparis tanakae]|uniref:Uncharacterized protein n=1 Tax=Liparis tanakae TaxID=230148 RepID=A0A4Z2JE31_9TELE|nr:hypothetical protein EYF80_001882 [Liparis tanakae]